jgi:hypothetical protein
VQRRLARSSRWMGGRTRRLLPAVALLCLGPLFYHRLLTPGWALADYDVVLYFVPYRAYLAHAWQQGRWLPLWNPHIYLGVPFLANIQAAALYPPNLLLLLLPPVAAVGWLVALHLGLAGAGMYLYGLVALRLRAAGSAVAALVFMLSAYLVSHAGHLNQSNTLGWSPWLMLAADRAARRPRPPALAAVAVLVALVILAGHSQQAYFSFILAAIAAVRQLWGPLVRRRRWLPSLRALLLLGLGVALGAGLASLQLAATAELVGQSVRSGGLPLADAGALSLPFRGIAGDLLPNYVGEHRSEFAGSFGAAALALIALALVARWRRPAIGLWAGLGLLGLAAAFGPRAVVYHVLFRVLPGLDLFRVPARLLLFTTIAAAVLAGYGTLTGCQLAAAWRRGRRRPVLRTLAGAAGISALPPAALLADRLFGASQQGIWAAFPYPPQPENLAGLVVFPAVALLLVAAGLAVRGLPAVALPLVVLVDLALLAGHTYPLNPLPDVMYGAGSAGASLAGIDADGRFLSLVPLDSQLTPTERVPAGLNPADAARYLGYLRLIDSQAANLSMTSGAADADGYDGGLLPTHAYVSFRQPLIPPDSSNQSDFTDELLTARVWHCDWLSQAGVRRVLAPQGVDPNPPAERCLRPSSSAGGIVAWRTVDTPPARARMAAGSAAHVTEDTGERVVVQLPEGAAGRLVLADTYYPGWTATVDGRGVPVERDGYVRAVEVPVGARTVVFEYHPAWLGRALAVTALSLLVTLALAASPLLRALRPAAAPRPPSAA